MAKRCPVGMLVQTLLFSREDFTVPQAKAWAKKHRFYSGKVDITANNIRMRQHPPSEFKSMRTITFGRGIKAVVGCPKS